MPVQEQNPEPSNPLGMDGIEFIEFATSQPQALGAVVADDGVHAGRPAPVARVTALPAGPMNLIVNRHAERFPECRRRSQRRRFPRSHSAYAMPITHGAAPLDLGAWEMPTRASAMELNIPGITALATACCTSSTATATFRSTTVDFVALPVWTNIRRHSRTCIIRRRSTIVDDRSADGSISIRSFSASRVLAGGQYFGIMPKGTLLESPCHKFYMQLLEPPPGSEDIEWEERLLRIGSARPIVRAAVVPRIASAVSCLSIATRSSRATRAR
jgi:4-hydroxyphenylpyruvate dioxygenase